MHEESYCLMEWRQRQLPGEFHSLVIDGPIFKQRINITKSRKILREGYWFLDIEEYELISKK